MGEGNGGTKFCLGSLQWHQFFLGNGLAGRLRRHVCQVPQSGQVPGHIESCESLSDLKSKGLGHRTELRMRDAIAKGNFKEFKRLQLKELKRIER